MIEKYKELCEKISKIEHTKGFELTEQQMDAIEFNRKAMKNSLDFINDSQDAKLKELNTNTFNLYYKRLLSLLNELE